MKNKAGRGRRGFTLIEMMIVIAVIAILAGITLTAVTSFQSRGRDTRRIGDMKTTQTLLELYFNQYGHYPGTAAGVTGDVAWAADWSTLTAALANVANNVPTPPAGGKLYHYTSDDSDGNVTYILGAELENDSSSINDSLSFPAHLTETCGSATKVYCVTSY